MSRSALASKPKAQAESGAELQEEAEANHASELQGREASQSEESPPAAVLAEMGQALPPALLRLMNARFGHDFSAVRVHTDGPAAASATERKAKAYTFGEHVVFAPGQYAPERVDGKSLIAHELAHVVQQSRGGAAVTAPGHRSALEGHARAAATALVQGNAPVTVGGNSAPGIAREGDDDFEDEDAARRRERRQKRQDDKARSGKREQDRKQARGGIQAAPDARARKEMQDLMEEVGSGKIKQLSPEEKLAKLRRFKQVLKDVDMPQLTKNQLQGQYDEQLRTTSRNRIGSPQTKWVAGGEQLPFMDLPAGEARYAQPDLSKRNPKRGEGEPERDHINLKSDTLDGLTPARARDKGRRYLKQAKRNARHLPTGDGIIIDFAEPASSAVRQEIVKQLFAKGSPVREVRFHNTVIRRKEWEAQEAAKKEAADREKQRKREEEKKAKKAASAANKKTGNKSGKKAGAAASTPKAGKKSTTGAGGKGAAKGKKAAAAAPPTGAAPTPGKKAAGQKASGKKPAAKKAAGAKKASAPKAAAAPASSKKGNKAASAATPAAPAQKSKGKKAAPVTAPKKANTKKAGKASAKTGPAPAQTADAPATTKGRGKKAAAASDAPPVNKVASPRKSKAKSSPITPPAPAQATPSPQQADTKAGPKKAAPATPAAPAQQTNPAAPKKPAAQKPPAQPAKKADASKAAATPPTTGKTQAAAPKAPPKAPPKKADAPKPAQTKPPKAKSPKPPASPPGKPGASSGNPGAMSLPGGHTAAPNGASGIAGPNRAGAQFNAGVQRTTQHKNGVNTHRSAAFGGKAWVETSEIPFAKPTRYRVVFHVQLGAQLSASAGKSQGAGGHAGVNASASMDLTIEHEFSAEETQKYLSQVNAGSSGAYKELKVAELAAGGSIADAQALAAQMKGMGGSAQSMANMREGDVISLGTSASVEGEAGVSGNRGATGVGGSLRAGKRVSWDKTLSLKNGYYVVNVMTGEGTDQGFDVSGSYAGVGMGGGAHSSQDRSKTVNFYIRADDPKRFDLLAKINTVQSMEALVKMQGEHPELASSTTDSTTLGEGNNASISLLGLSLEIFEQGDVGEHVTQAPDGTTRVYTANGTGGARLKAGDQPILSGSDTNSFMGGAGPDNVGFGETKNVQRETELIRSGQKFVENVVKAPVGTLVGTANGSMPVLVESERQDGATMSDDSYGVFIELAKNESAWSNQWSGSFGTWQDWMATRHEVRKAGTNRQLIAKAIAEFEGKAGAGRSDTVQNAMGDTGMAFEFPDSLKHLKPLYDSLIGSNPVAAAQAAGSEEAMLTSLRRSADELAGLRESLHNKATEFQKPSAHIEMMQRIRARRSEVQAAISYLTKPKVAAPVAHDPNFVGPPTPEPEPDPAAEETAKKEAAEAKELEITTLIQDMGSYKKLEASVFANMQKELDAWFTSSITLINEENRLKQAYPKWDKDMKKLRQLLKDAGGDLSRADALAPDRARYLALDRQIPFHSYGSGLPGYEEI